MAEQDVARILFADFLLKPNLATKDQPTDFPSFKNLFQCPTKQFKEFSALFQAIDEYTRFVKKKKIVKEFNFYKDLAPAILRWTAEHRPKKIPLLARGSSQTITFSARNIRSILANAFFCNLKTANSLKASGRKVQGEYGNLCFAGILDGREVGKHRLMCQLSYFHQCLLHENEDVDHMVTFTRIHTRQEDLFDWPACTTPVQSCNVKLHKGRMEDSKGAFVDFANKFIHINEIIPSCTQEEVLFSCCPEAFTCLLCIDTLMANEAVIIHGARRYTDYQGYGMSFKFAGEMKPPRQAIPIIVIDALIASQINQFSPANVLRDLNKAWIAFGPFTDTAISTGPWGCGAFGGDKTLKYLQQLCAAAVTGASLDYCCWKGDFFKELKELQRALALADPTVGQIFNILTAFERRSGVLPHVLAKLRELGSPKPANQSDGFAGIL